MESFTVPSHTEQFTHKNLKTGTTLLNQELWCLGADIRNHGNILCTRGYERWKLDEKTPSFYTVRWGENRIYLWSNALYIQHPSLPGVRLPRFDFLPQVYPPSTEIFPASSLLPPSLEREEVTDSECIAAQLAVLYEFLAGYERDIIQTYGVPYRISVVKEWKRLKKPIVPAENMSSLWAEYSRQALQILMY